MNVADLIEKLGTVDPRTKVNLEDSFETFFSNVHGAELEEATEAEDVVTEAEAEKPVDPTDPTQVPSASIETTVDSGTSVDPASSSESTSEVASTEQTDTLVENPPSEGQ